MKNYHLNFIDSNINELKEVNSVNMLVSHLTNVNIKHATFH